MNPHTTITMLLLFGVTACVSLDATELDEVAASESAISIAAVPVCSPNPGVSFAAGRTHDGDRPGRIEVDLDVHYANTINTTCKADVTMTSLDNNGDPVYKVVPTQFNFGTDGKRYRPFSRLDNHPSTFTAQVCIITGSSSSCKQVNIFPGVLFP